MLRDTISRGRVGEAYTEAYFIQRGFQLIRRNFRTRIGEIDLILTRDEELLFVEVKTLFDQSQFPIQDRVDQLKLRNIKSTAQIFMSTYHSFGIHEFNIILVEVRCLTRYNFLSGQNNPSEEAEYSCSIVKITELGV